MSYVLYGAPGSGSGIIEAALVELGVAFELRDLDARRGEHREAAYAAVNPQRKMPALVLEDGAVCTEVLAILLVLEARHGGLLPEGPARVQALRWLAFLAGELYPLVEILDHPERFAPPEAAAEMKVRAHARWQARWQVLEEGLGGGLERGPGLALALTAAVLSRWDLEPTWRAQHLPRVQAMREAVLARPALAGVWARHEPRGG